MIQLSGPGATRAGAANDYEIVSLARAKTILGMAATTGKDVALQALLDSVHQRAYRFCGSRIFKRNATPFVQVYSGTGSRFMQLRQFPIGTLSAIEEGYMNDATTFVVTRTFATNEYAIVHENGQLHAIGLGYFSEGRFNLRVTYTAGYPAGQIPGDLETALVDWVGLSLQRIDLKSWSLTGVSREDEQRTFDLGEMPKGTEAALKRYQRLESLLA